MSTAWTFPRKYGQGRSPRRSASSRGCPRSAQHLIGRQRGIIKTAEPGIVAEGRDIGTVVAPHAQLKVFLTADSQARARAPRGRAEGRGRQTEADQARRDRLDAAQSAKAADAVLIDATDLSLPAVIDEITRLARERRAAHMRSGARGLSPANWQSAGESMQVKGADQVEPSETSEPGTGQLETGQPETDEPESGQPVLAVVGRPNVGKSTLVNRILGSRQAVVEDVPGVTRDRVAYDANWRGRPFTVVDTGGWEARAQGLAAQVAEQAKIAVGLADAVLFVVDARVGATDADEAVARTCCAGRASRSCSSANKVDDAKSESDASRCGRWASASPSWSPPCTAGAAATCSTWRSRRCPRRRRSGRNESGPRRVALIGRPNVGKSSLLNKLAGEQRAVVDSVAGTTGDPVDELIELGGTTWRFVDTAGIRRRFRESQGADYYATLRTAGARSTGPRSRWCSSTRASRSPSRTCASSRW